MPIKVGFICGKDTDFVEHPGAGPLYSAIGDPSFLDALPPPAFPNGLRVDPVSHEYVKDCAPGTTGQAHVDCALAFYILKNFKDIQVDIIPADELTPSRLSKNDLNFTLGFNAVNILIEGPYSGNKVKERQMKALMQSPNIFPTWEFEDFILTKSTYLKALIAAGVPVAPTIFALKGARSPAGLLQQIKERGWKKFVLKQSESGFCLGFLKLSVQQCEKNPQELEAYFRDFAHVSEYIVQECIDGFVRNWETRCFFFNDEFLYAIANKAAVSTKDGKEHIVTGSDIPKEFHDNAKKIGQRAVQVLPRMKTAGGKSVKNILVRVDVGCSDSQIYDRDTKWDPTKNTFFVNEIEPSSTTYFARWLKFDCMPLYGRLYAEKAREIYVHMKKAGTTYLDRKAKSRAKAKAKAPKAKAATAPKARAAKDAKLAKATTKAKAKAKGPKAKVAKAGKVKTRAP